MHQNRTVKKAGFSSTDQSAALEPRRGTPDGKASTPSYLHPTAAHKARVSGESDSGMAGMYASSPGPLLPAVPEDPRRAARRRNLFARMASTLLAPTQV